MYHNPSDLDIIVISLNEIQDMCNCVFCWCPKDTKNCLNCRKKYCKEHKIKGVSDKSIQITLQNEFGATDDRKNINDEYTYIWEGIKLRSSF